MLIHDLFGKQVIALEQGRRVGKVTGASISRSRQSVSHLRVRSDEKGPELLLPWRAVRAVGDDAVTIDSAASFVENSPDQQTGDLLDFVGAREVITEGGRRLGALSGYCIDPRTGQVQSYVLTDLQILGFAIGDQHQIAAEHVRTIGDDVVIVSDDALQAPYRPAGEGEEVPYDPEAAAEGAATIPPA